MGLEDITNFLEVTPLIGTAGMPTPEQLNDIRAAGYELVINLALDDSPDAIADEASRVRDLGMDYIHLPVEWESPTQSNLEHFFWAMEASTERKVFVHCVKNMRVTAFMYLYLVLLRETPVEDAMNMVLRVWEPNETWTDFMRSVLRSYGKEDHWPTWF